MKTTLLFLFVFLSASLFGQNVYIPDANFKAYLVGNPNINTNGDTEIQLSEASVFDGGIECQLLEINDLTGIEAFTSLTLLNCGSNYLLNLNLTQNTALEYLNCQGNYLSNLNINEQNELIELRCAGMQLTNLDLSQNTVLTYLSCKQNNITNLDLSQNIFLEYLDCGNNYLPNLDISSNAALKYLDCFYTFPINLNLSANVDLEYLFCHGNLLTSLDVSQNPSLIRLDCQNNKLSSLDVSQNYNLIRLSCYGNDELTCLNVANGNNYNFEFFSAQVISSLNCIQVDDAAWSTANWTNIEPQMYFSENCNYPSDCFTNTMDELTTSNNLIQILDMMGRETSFKPNTPLIYVYDDGTTEKVFTIE